MENFIGIERFAISLIIIVLGLVIIFTFRYIYWEYWYDHSDTEDFIILDIFGDWYNSDLGYTISIGSSKALYSRGYSCHISKGRGVFIDPFSTSCQIDDVDNVITIKGTYIYTGRSRIDEILLYMTMNPNRKAYKIDDKDYILNDKMIELKFKYIFKDINKLELIPLNENSKLFTFNQNTTLWHKKK